MEKQLHITVHGRVQGVGFRYTTQRHAQDTGITGWVRNEHDGTVTVMAKGTEERLKSFMEKMERGSSPYARVSSFDITTCDTTQSFDDFRVRTS